MSEKQEIFWHLPGLCSFRLLNQILMNTMEAYPEKFRDGYRIGSVYGTIPGAIWNGGRTVLGSTTRPEIERIVETYNSRGIPVRFTWTNSLIEEMHVRDTYCNMIMKVADNGMNQVLVNRPVLEEYIRKEYPGYRLISSTTKRILDAEEIRRETGKDYFLVVLDYDLNKDEKVLKDLEPVADKMEILVNEICYPNCPKRLEHYRDESRLQLEYDTRSDFRCPNKIEERRNFKECMTRPAFLSNEDIEKYAQRGYVNFKIVGRGLPMEFVMDSYLYYLVKDEHREFIRNYMIKVLNDISNAQRQNRR